MSFYWGLSRTMCDVLEEMRQASKSRNYSYIDGLIEEVQTMGNRMESGLERYKSMETAEQHILDLKSEIKELESKKRSAKRETK
jgi:hypothetical protein